MAIRLRPYNNKLRFKDKINCLHKYHLDSILWSSHTLGNMAYLSKYLQHSSCILVCTRISLDFSHSMLEWQDL